MISDNIKYRFALIDGTDNIVDIADLNRESVQGLSFICPHCQKTMYATFGPIREKHFRHNEHKCEPDRYLHAAAEMVFVEEFRKCVKESKPFTIEYTVLAKCDRKCVFKNRCKIFGSFSIDLAAEFDIISREHRVDIDDRYRRPDLLLESIDGRQLWVEIWVTHETGKEKMKDASIIELKIGSENDLEQIRNHHMVAAKTSDLDKAFSSKPVTINQYDVNNCVNFLPLPEDIVRNFPRLPIKKRPNPVQKSDSIFDESEAEWIDLGLPSGTLWSKENMSNSISFFTAKEIYGKFLPSVSMAEELRKYCSTEWDEETRTLVLTGPNGNSIDILCTNKDTTTIWLNDYVPTKPWEEKFGKCMKVYDKKYLLINDDSAATPASVHLAKIYRP